MAKSNALRSGGRSHIRFIMLDADLNEGELNQVTQAIQNALTPANRNAPMRLVATPAQVTDANDAQSDTVNDLQADLVDGPVEVPVTDGGSPRRTGPRKFRVPKVIDVDLNSDPSFASFAQKIGPTSQLKKFLTVAAWFKLHRGIDAITVDHVYTCFRSVGWPSGISDFDGPFRSLKRSQLVTSSDSGYAINHLGLDQIEKTPT